MSSRECGLGRVLDPSEPVKPVSDNQLQEYAMCPSGWAIELPQSMRTYKPTIIQAWQASSATYRQKLESMKKSSKNTNDSQHANTEVHKVIGPAVAGFVQRYLLVGYIIPVPDAKFTKTAPYARTRVVVGVDKPTTEAITAWTQDGQTPLTAVVPIPNINEGTGGFKIYALLDPDEYGLYTPYRATRSEVFYLYPFRDNIHGRGVEKRGLHWGIITMDAAAKLSGNLPKHGGLAKGGSDGSHRDHSATVANFGPVNGALNTAQQPNDSTVNPLELIIETRDAADKFTPMKSKANSAEFGSVHGVVNTTRQPNDDTVSPRDLITQTVEPTDEYTPTKSKANSANGAKQAHCRVTAVQCKANEASPFSDKPNDGTVDPFDVIIRAEESTDGSTPTKSEADSANGTDNSANPGQYLDIDAKGQVETNAPLKEENATTSRGDYITEGEATQLVFGDGLIDHEFDVEKTDAFEEIAEPLNAYQNNGIPLIPAAWGVDPDAQLVQAAEQLANKIQNLVRAFKATQDPRIAQALWYVVGETKHGYERLPQRVEMFFSENRMLEDHEYEMIALDINTLWPDIRNVNVDYLKMIREALSALGGTVHKRLRRALLAESIHQMHTVNLQRDELSSHFATAMTIVLQAQITVGRVLPKSVCIPDSFNVIGGAKMPAKED